MSKNNGLLLRGQIWHMRFAIKGVQVAESTFTANRREAELILAKRRTELHQDVVLDDKRVVSFHAAIDQFVKERATASAKKNANYNLKHFKDITDKPIKKVQKHEIQAIIEKRKVSGLKMSVIDLHIRYWNAFVNWCVAQKYHNCGKLDNVKPNEGKTRWLTIEEQNKLLAALHPSLTYRNKTPFMIQCKQDNYDITIMLLDTGMRFMEVASMLWTQVDIDKRHIYVTRSKGGKHTTLTMTSRLKDILERRKSNGNDHIFPTKHGKNRSAGWMTPAVKRAKLNTSNGNITPHVMRHTFAATMIQNGMSLSEVQHLLGHQNITMTQRYAHFVKQDAADKAAAILESLNQLNTAYTTL